MICRNDNCLTLGIHDEGVRCRFKGKPRGRITPEHRLKITAGLLKISLEEYIAHLDRNERHCSVCDQWKDATIEFHRDTRRCRSCMRLRLDALNRRTQAGREARRDRDRIYQARKRRGELHDEKDLHASDDRPGDGEADQDSA